MLGVIALVLGGFVLLVRSSYRGALRSGEPFRPAGKLRWDVPPQSGGFPDAGGASSDPPPTEP